MPSATSSSNIIAGIISAMVLLVVAVVLGYYQRKRDQMPCFKMRHELTYAEPSTYIRPLPDRPANYTNVRAYIIPRSDRYSEIDHVYAHMEPNGIIPNSTDS